MSDNKTVTSHSLHLLASASPFAAADQYQNQEQDNNHAIPPDKDEEGEEADEEEQSDEELLEDDDSFSLAPSSTEVRGNNTNSRTTNARVRRWIRKNLPATPSSSQPRTQLKNKSGLARPGAAAKLAKGSEEADGAPRPSKAVLGASDGAPGPSKVAPKPSDAAPEPLRAASGPSRSAPGPSHTAPATPHTAPGPSRAAAPTKNITFHTNPQNARRVPPPKWSAQPQTVTTNTGTGKGKPMRKGRSGGKRKRKGNSNNAAHALQPLANANANRAPTARRVDVTRKRRTDDTTDQRRSRRLSGLPVLDEGRYNPRPRRAG